MGLSPTLAVAVDHCWAAINNDPRLLLETAGGPVGRTANVIVARLYGWDEQVDDEMRLRRVEAVLLVPILERLTLATMDSPTLADYRPPRTARYDLQSNYAMASIAAEYAPDESHGDDFLVSVLCVRYKRTDRVPR